MKKVLSVFLALIIVVSLCACSSQNGKIDTASVDQALQGSWVSGGDIGGPCYKFENGYFASTAIVLGIQVGSNKGSYTIEDDAIKIIYSNLDDPSYLPYTFNKNTGELRLYLNEDKTNELIMGEWSPLAN